MTALDSVKIDPAAERWNLMRESSYKYFRWTPRTTRIALIGLVVIPGTLYYTFSKLELKYKWTAARKGQSLLAHPPVAGNGEASGEE